MKKKAAWIFVGILLLLSAIAIITGKLHKTAEPSETEIPETETMIVIEETESERDTPESAESQEPAESETRIRHDEILDAEEDLSEEAFSVEETKEISPDLEISVDFSALDDYRAEVAFEDEKASLVSVTKWYAAQLGYTGEVMVTINPVFDYDRELRTFHYLATLNSEHESVLLYNLTYSAWSYREVGE